MRRRGLWWWTATLMGVLVVAVRAASADGPAARPGQAVAVVVNEVAYDPPPAGSENGYEWVELLNAGPSPVTLEGWRIADGRASDEIPTTTLASGEYLVVAAGDGFTELYPEFGGRVVTVGGSIGNGLGNSGDRVVLLGPDGATVDGMSYGDDAGVLDPAIPDADAGHSLERVPAGRDTDTAGDWIDQPAPSPGGPAGDVRPTAPPATTPPPSLPPGAGPVLNELLPAPRDVDWDGDGTAGAKDEWVELFNPGEVTLDLRGWRLDDVADGGSPPFAFPDGTVVASHGYLLVFQRDSGLALNNGSDSVRLLAPDGTVADEVAYRDVKPDQSLARDGDGSGSWTDSIPPTPGRSNRSAGGTPGPGPVPTSGPDPNPSPTPQRQQPTPTRGQPAPSPATPGPGPRGTPSPAYLPFLVSEVLFDPVAPGTDAAAEWVELHNRTDVAVDLAGWAIGDRGAWDVLPAALVPPRGFALVAGSAAALAPGTSGGAPVVVVADGRIGGGLGNGGDIVRLRGPTGDLADALSYGDNLDAFDPAVPIGPPGCSIERLPADADTDTADDWWIQPAPSPGRAGARHEGPPRVVLNEVLPAPRSVDWDGDGAAAFTDEWVELVNDAGYPVDLADWRLERDRPDGWSYRFPRGAQIETGAFLVIHRTVSGLALGNDADALRLVRPDGVVADRFAWDRSPGYDRSWCRIVDGSGTWASDYEVTPGRPNRRRDGTPAGRTSAGPARPDADATRSPDPARVTHLADVRLLGTGPRVQVRGRITVPPGVYGAREAYVGDDGAGVRLFLRKQTDRLPAVAEGATVLATGVLRDFHGEREIVLERGTDLWVDDRDAIRPVVPATVATGAVGEGIEGALVRISGRIVGFSGPTITLDDGSGPARVVVRTGSGIRRPWVSAGARLDVVGVVGQYARRAPWEGGYRLTPRRLADFGSESGQVRTVPERLPATGRAETGRTGIGSMPPALDCRTPELPATPARRARPLPPGR